MNVYIIDTKPTKRPTIIIPQYNIDEPQIQSIYKKQMVVLTEDDKKYLNEWREKAKKKYKKYFGYKYLQSDDEAALIDPDPFAKWYIFHIDKKSRSAVSTPSVTPALTSKEWPSIDMSIINLL